MRKSMEKIGWLIYRINHPVLRSMFMAPSDRFRMRAGLTAILAGNLQRSWRYSVPLLAFKSAFYALSLAYRFGFPTASSAWFRSIGGMSRKSSQWFNSLKVCPILYSDLLRQLCSPVRSRFLRDGFSHRALPPLIRPCAQRDGRRIFAVIGLLGSRPRRRQSVEPCDHRLVSVVGHADAHSTSLNRASGGRDRKYGRWISIILAISSRRGARRSTAVELKQASSSIFDLQLPLEYRDME